MMLAVAAVLLFAQAPTAESLSGQALAMAQQNRPAEAEKLWKQALALSPKLFAANFNLGYFYYSRQDMPQAAPYLERAAEAQPKDFNARYLAGAALSQLGRTDAALRHWRAAIALRPDHAKLLQLMAVEYGKGRYFQDAAEAAERALTLAGDDANLYLLAIKARQDGQDHPAALKLTARMIARYPAHPRALFEHGYELYRAGRAVEGLPFLKRAMESPETWEEPFFFYGELLVGQGNHGDAIAPLRKAIALRRDYIAAWSLLARALMGMGQLEEAKATLDEAVAINPKHPQPHLLLSQIYFRLGDEEKAASEKALSLKLRREDPGALETLPGRRFPR